MPIQTGNSKVNKLVCRCKPLSGLKECLVDGYEITIEKHYWAGDPAGVNSEVRRNITKLRVDNFPKYEAALQGEMERFTTGYCTSQFCDKSILLHDWNLRKDNPCNTDLRRDGPLCTLCEEGYYLVPFDTEVSRRPFSQLIWPLPSAHFQQCE